MDTSLKYYKHDTKIIHKVPLFENVPDYLKYASKVNPFYIAMKIKRNDKYEVWNYKQLKESTYKCAKSILKMNLTPGCSININSYNNPQWFIIFYACVFSKYLPTGIYTTSSSSQCQYYFNHSNAEMLFVEDENRLKKYIEIKDNIPKCKAIVLMESLDENMYHDYSNLPFKIFKWNEFIELGRDIDDKNIDEISSSIKNDDQLSLLFTSGTSSTPKGCILSHKNYIHSSYYGIQSFLKKEIVYGTEKFVSYLPLSHVTDQIGNLVTPLLMQAQVVFGDRDALRGTLVNVLKEENPTCFIGVPRVWEKIHFKIESEIRKMNIFKRYLVEWGLKVGLENTYKRERGEPSTYEYNIAYNLVIKKILESIGLSRVHKAVSGSAPLSKNTISFFKSIGIYVSNCYGLTETCGATVIEIPNEAIQSVGRVNNAEILIADDGEILLKGGFVFQGYYNDIESTKQSIDSKGWFHTGDIGHLDKLGNLFITDRKKDIIITSGGENIAPSMIEGKLRMIPGVEHAAVYGDKQKFLVCLVVINLDFFNQYFKSKEQDVKFISINEASNDININKYIQDKINEVNKDLAQVQTIKRFKILPNEFTEGNEQSEITATKKLRRKVVNEKYQYEIKQLYGDLYFES